MKRTLGLIYSIASYLFFFATFLYTVGFLGNFLVPKAIDSVPNVPLAQAMLINLGLLIMFSVQHSVMARPFFKRWITRYIPRALERSTYVVASSVALIAVMFFWEPMGGLIWNIESGPGVYLVYGGFVFGWTLLFLSTCLLNHFDLFGLRQAWLYFRGRDYTPLEFNSPWLYRVIRHPLYLGWLFAIWCTPLMTLTHLVFGILTTAYIFIGIHFEEKDLVDAHPEYEDYREQVPMILPLTKGNVAVELPRDLSPEQA